MNRIMGAINQVAYVIVWNKNSVGLTLYKAKNTRGGSSGYVCKCCSIGKLTSGFYYKDNNMDTWLYWTHLLLPNLTQLKKL